MIPAPDRRAPGTARGERQQPYLGDSGIPRGLVTDDGVEDGEKLAHASDDGDLFRFASSDEPLVGRADHRVGTECADGGHVKHGANFATTAPDASSPDTFAAIVVQGC